MEKITMKIDREVHKKLQMYKIDSNSKTISEAIDKLLETEKEFHKILDELEK